MLNQEPAQNKNNLKSNTGLKEMLLELIKFNWHTVSELLDETLAHVISFTSSKIGYIFLYDEEKQEFILHSWSDVVLKECKITDKSRLYYLENVGLWGEVVRQRKPIIINDYKSSNFIKKGYPAGHIPIRNFISVPVFHKGKITAVAAAANKVSDYSDEDVFNLNLLMNTVWPAVEHIRDEEMLIKERVLLKTILFSIMEGIIATDASGKITLMNKMAEQYTGWQNEEACGKDFSQVFHNIDIATGEEGPDPVSYVLQKKGSVFESQDNTLLKSKDGSEINITVRASRIASESGEMTGVAVSFRDITKEFLQEREIEGFIKVNLDMLSVTDAGGNFRRVNRKFEKVLGYSSPEIEGKNFLSFIHKDDIPATEALINKLKTINKIPGFTNRFLCKDGTYKYIEWYMQPGIGKFTYSSARDVTEKHLREERLQHMAVRDELTGLYNRHFLETIITELIERSDRYKEPLSMAMLDLDHFKLVNDKWGHPSGDELLKLTAQVIKDNIRSADILVRFGGEEFILIMPQTTIEGAIEASEKIRSAIEKKEHIITGKQTISIGVAMRIMHESFESWYRRVDAALYRAKNEGRNRVAVYDSSQKMAPDSISLEWREEWESGSTEIDRQHRELLEGANRLIYMSMSGSKHEEMVKLLDLIIEHAVMHFNYEEELLAKIRYPDLEAHARIHKNLAGEAMRLKKSFHEGNIDASAFFSFIADKIILEHMLTSDINYYEYTWKNL